MTDKKRIGEILVDMGLASRDLVVECLNVQTEIHRKGQATIPLGALLVRSGYVSMDDLEKALNEQSKYRLPS